MYKTFSFMAVIDGNAKFFEFQAVDRDGAIADLKETYGASEVEIYLWREV